MIAPETAEAGGEAQAGRRRGRCGGRGGRDRDESRDSENRPGPASLDDGGATTPVAGNEATTDAAMPMSEPSAEGRASSEARTDERSDGRPQRGSGRDRNRRPRRDETPQAADTQDPAFDAGEPSAPRVEPATPEPLSQVVSSPAPSVVAAFHVPAEPAVSPAVTTPAVAEVPNYVLPLDSLQAIAASSGLQWINSDADKIRLVQEAMAREPQPVHVPRERKALLKIDEGPLVLVETRKDLSQIKLPFEAAETH